MSQNKNGYFQGGGGVNEPTPGKKKYKSDKAILVQPRFKEPFYRNFDAYETEGVDGAPKLGPGAGWHHMNKYKSIQEFRDAKRKHMKDKYKADDFWIEDTEENRKERIDKMRTRASLLCRITKTAQKNYDYGKGLYENMDKYKSVEEFRDVNSLDFPIDDQVTPILGDSGSYSDSVPIGGQLDEYLTQNDSEGKSPKELNFGRDYDGEAKQGPKNLDKLMTKYLDKGDPDTLYGLPDGIRKEDTDELTQPNNINSQYGETNSGNTIYNEMWL